MQQEVCLSSNKQNTHPGFFKTREETEDWLYKMFIYAYTIKDDLTVDIDGGLSLNTKHLDYIPVQFGVVNGSFYCSRNNLTSLKGCPTKVLGDFSCYSNNLTSLEYCPTEVGGYFDCADNKLTSLKGCPTEVGGAFDCESNNLISLKHCPTKVGTWFSCSHNNLNSLDHCPKEVDGGFFCSNNNLTSLEHCPTYVRKLFSCENNIIVSEIPNGYYGKDNPSWETDDPELISSRFFDKFEGLDFDTKVDVLNILKEAQPGFYNSAAFQVYNPDSMLSLMKRSREATGGLFEL